MVVWQGITEDGSATPVQVTADGKVVAQSQPGAQGPEGPPGADSQVPGPQGPQGPAGKDGKDGLDAVNEPFDGSLLAYRGGNVLWIEDTTPPAGSKIYKINQFQPNYNGDGMVLLGTSDVPIDDINSNDVVYMCDITGVPFNPRVTGTVYRRNTSYLDLYQGAGSFRIGNYFAVDSYAFNLETIAHYVRLKIAEAADIVAED